MLDFVALVAAILVTIGVHHLGATLTQELYPLREGLDPNDVSIVARHLIAAPPLALLSVLLTKAAAAFAGGAVIGKLATRKPTTLAGLLGLGVLLTTIAPLLAVPHPWWFMVGCPLICVPAAWKGAAWLAP